MYASLVSRFDCWLLLPYPLLLARYVVHQDVLAQCLGGGVEGAAFVDLGHLLDEVGHVVAALQHEGVDGYTVAGATHYLAHRLLDCAVGGRVVEEDLAVFLEVGCRLAVCDDDYLLVGASPSA